LRIYSQNGKKAQPVAYIFALDAILKIY